MRPILWLVLTPVGIQNGFEEHEKVEGFPHFQSPGFQFTPEYIENPDCLECCRKGQWQGKVSP